EVDVVVGPLLRPQQGVDAPPAVDPAPDTGDLDGPDDGDGVPSADHGPVRPHRARPSPTMVPWTDHRLAAPTPRCSSGAGWPLCPAGSQSGRPGSGWWRRVVSGPCSAGSIPASTGPTRRPWPTGLGCIRS